MLQNINTERGRNEKDETSWELEDFSSHWEYDSDRAGTSMLSSSDTSSSAGNDSDLENEKESMDELKTQGGIQTTQTRQSENGWYCEPLQTRQRENGWY